MMRDELKKEKKLFLLLMFQNESVCLQATRGECTQWDGGTRGNCSLQAWTGEMLWFWKSQVKYQDGRHLATAR